MSLPRLESSAFPVIEPANSQRYVTSRDRPPSSFKKARADSISAFLRSSWG